MENEEWKMERFDGSEGEKKVEAFGVVERESLASLITLANKGSR
jgi:hypothetical protein